MHNATAMKASQRLWNGRVTAGRGAGGGCRGFTLIELLVVISVVALLMALLLPALQASRTVAQRAVSLSNVRQLAMAHHSYAGDNRSSLPFLRRGMASLGQPNLPTWAGVFWRSNYITSLDVLWSPGRDRTGLDFSLSLTTGYTPTMYPGYGMNKDISCEEIETRPEYTGVKKEPAKLDQRGLPPVSEFLLLGEVFSNEAPSRGSQAGYWTIAPDYMVRPRPFPFTYAGGHVRAYLDGHGSASDSRDIGWTATSSYEGAWVYTKRQEMEKKPWFDDWRNNY